MLIIVIVYAKVYIQGGGLKMSYFKLPLLGSVWGLTGTEHGGYITKKV